MPKSLLTRAVRNTGAILRGAEFGDSSIPTNGSLGSFGAAVAAGPGGVLGIATVLACVKVLHDDFTALGFAAYQGDPLGARAPIPKQPIIVTDPFGAELDLAAGMGQICVSRVMRGNAYLQVVDEDAFGFPTAVTILEPDKVRPYRNDAGFKRFRMGYNDSYGPDEIKHIAGMMMPGAVAGVDVLTVQRNEFELANDVATYAAGFFGSGGSPSGVIQVPGNLNRQKAKLIREQWMSAHAGPTKAHLPAVLPGGAEWKPLSVTPENAQFLETRRYLREEICGIFGVPLQRVQAIVENASQGGGKGLDAIDHGYVTHTLRPIALSIQRCFNRMVPGGGRTFTQFDFGTLLRPGALERSIIAQSHRVGGIRTRDEIRADEGLAPLPEGMGGDDPNAPLNSNVGASGASGGASQAPDPATIPSSSDEGAAQ